MKIQVTQNDIDYGIARCANGCAVALAVKRQIPYEISYLGIDGEYVTICLPHQEDTLYYELPNEVKDFIAKFDRDRKDCEPIEFDVNIPNRLQS